MFGDDPDPTVTTARVGSGTISGAHVRGSMHCAERVSDRAVASDNSGSEEGKEDGLSGLWRDCEGEKRERGPGICFWRPKTSDEKTGYNAAIV